MKHTALTAALLTALVLPPSASHALGAAGRQPLAKPTLNPSINQRVVGGDVDPKTGAPRDHDYEATVTVDKTSGFVTYRWTDEDGRRNSVTFEPGTRVDVVATGVVVAVGERRYSYRYGLDVAATSAQRLQIFSVETSAPILTAQRPDWGWDSRPLEPRDYGSENTSPGWSWVDIKYGRTGISPGTRQAGFGLESPALPGLVPCRAQGYTEGQEVERPDELPPAIAAIIDWRSVRAFLRGSTVGPVEYAEQPAAHLDQLAAQVEPMVGLGWVGSPEPAASLRSRFADIRSAIGAGKVDVAITQLKDLADQLRRWQQSGELLSESFGILFFNCEAIRAKLASPAPRVSRGAVAPRAPGSLSRLAR